MTDGSAQRLVQRYQSVRARTEQLAAPLSDEDQQVQSMPACSPTKWHRAHTTWFFETFLLAPRGVPVFDARFGSIFNSYYNALGTPFTRAARGLLTRPTAREIGAYRRAIDGRMIEVLGSLAPPELAEVLPLIELGLAHEEQHQELLLTDVLHAFAQNPLAPVYRSLEARADTHPGVATPSSARGALEFHRHEGGLVECGSRGDGFAFDNEQPRHRVYLEPFSFASRLVTWAELSAFVEEHGYQTPSLWLADGWDFVRSEGLCAPFYSRLESGEWRVFSLRGERTPVPDEP
ncbi:MAG TPA: DinB family protein, partial [Polyangiaceae bacterium]